MSHKLKLPALFVSAVMLCSCGTSHTVVIDHSIGSAAPPESAVHAGFTAAPEIVPAVTAEFTSPGISTAVELQDEKFIQALPIPESVHPIEPAAEPEETAAETEPPEQMVSINSSMLALSSAPKKYDYEQQHTNGSLMILGSNLVYVGESFDFSYIYPDADKSTEIFWAVVGSGGKIDENGRFTAVEKSVCNVIATDRETGIFASIRVHCIENADDVDFIPLVNSIPIANKTYPLPKDYDPGLSYEARSAFISLQNDAAAQGLNIYPISAYRSYSYQQQVYAGWVDMYGSDADLVSARPGHSEHQLGLAIDVNCAEYSFANTPEGKWLQQHCADYGFILRYPSFDSKLSTGYSYEPWHIRYLGKELARTVTDSGRTLEELLNIDSYYR